jgi:hypothetical protein
VLSVGWLLFAVVVAILLTVWVMVTLTRLDRLHARVDAAWAALDAQLVRRDAEVLAALTSGRSGLDRGRADDVEQAVHAAISEATPPDERQDAENTVGKALLEMLASSRSLRDIQRRELNDAANKVMIARRFYNDAVRDTQSLRGRRMPRLFHLAGHRDMPQYFDIDDTVPPVVVPPVGM